MAAYAKAQAEDPTPTSLKEQADDRWLKPASVYVIECAGRVKIGHAIDVQKRLASINTSAPAPAVLRGSVELAYTDQARHYERRLHQTFASARSNREWFDLPVDTALAALEEIRVALEKEPPKPFPVRAAQ